jgi:predicted SPOUT superfamily RNA methylase MTH1
LKCFILEDEPGRMTRLSIAIPASVVSDTPHLREKTAKLGAIARASSIFGVNEIILYPDDPQRRQEADMKFCAEILQYLETPQYLRKRMFRLTPSLRFTGILPPLQAPHHNVPPSMADVKVGDVREGLVISRSGHDLVVDAGLENSVFARGAHGVGERVTLSLVSVGKNLRAEIVERSKISIYWGYRVTRSKSKLTNVLERERFDLRIGTSRYGIQIQEVWTEITNSLRSASSTLIAFGSPKMGLTEILAQEGKRPTDVFNFFVNTVPDQNVATVRTEEAVFISLGILNAMRQG